MRSFAFLSFAMLQLFSFAPSFAPAQEAKGERLSKKSLFDDYKIEKEEIPQKDDSTKTEAKIFIRFPSVAVNFELGKTGKWTRAESEVVWLGGLNPEKIEVRSFVLPAQREYCFVKCEEYIQGNGSMTETHNYLLFWNGEGIDVLYGEKTLPTESIDITAPFIAPLFVMTKQTELTFARHGDRIMGGHVNKNDAAWIGPFWGPARYSSKYEEVRTAVMEISMHAHDGNSLRPLSRSGFLKIGPGVGTFGELLNFLTNLSEISKSRFRPFDLSPDAVLAENNGVPFDNQVILPLRIREIQGTTISDPVRDSGYTVPDRP